MSYEEPSPRGHWPSLIAAFLYAAASLLAWGLLGAMGEVVAIELGLASAQSAVLVAVPILVGIGLRPAAGLLTDILGARRVALAGLSVTAVPLLLGWLWARSFDQLVLVGALLGVAGASLGVALTMAGRWYPAEKQGLVLGLAGAGSGGTALGLVLAPWMLQRVGWPDLFGLAIVPLALAFAAVALLAREPAAPPGLPSLRAILPSLAKHDIHWYGLFDALVFGGFVGMPGFLAVFLRDQYQIDAVHAGIVAGLCALGGSLARPFGGWLADHYGGTPILLLVYVGLGVLGLRMSYIPHFEAGLIWLLIMLALMGIGNGAVFQMMARRRPEPFGTMAGLLAAAGGLGGLLLPRLMEDARDWLGHFGPVFLAMGLGALLASGLLLQVSRRWQAEARHARDINIGARAARHDIEMMSPT